MKKLLIGLILGMFAFGALPAAATHVNEPTTPITSIQLRVFNYPEGIKDPNFAVDCTDDLNIETFANHQVGGSSPARIEGYVGSDTYPSEHFIVRIDVNFRPRFPASSTANPDWNNEWGHQNIPPHPNVGIANDGRFKAVNANQYFSIKSRDGEIFKPFGVWEVIMTVTGQESGNVFTEVCRFDTRP